MTSDLPVHVIDDDEAVRDSLALLLMSAGFDAVPHASATLFLATAPDLQKGCVITDIRMPEMTGLELAAKLKDLGSALPLIVITGHGDVPLAVQAMKLGAADFIEKPFDDEVLLNSVRLAMSSGAEKQDPQAAATVEKLNALSNRERQVVDGLVAGKSNKVIAIDLEISPRTVEVYRANVMTKMQVSSLSELVRLVILAGR
jgi:two-component system, LuxR family, response regulator FixJ